eukprot:6467019-Amphidinium_carterae.1
MLCSQCTKPWAHDKRLEAWRAYRGDSPTGKPPVSSTGGRYHLSNQRTLYPRTKLQKFANRSLTLLEAPHLPLHLTKIQ